MRRVGPAGARYWLCLMLVIRACCLKATSLVVISLKVADLIVFSAHCLEFKDAD